MTIKQFTVAATTIVVALAMSLQASAQQRPIDGKVPKFDFGKVEYESKCASCHGLKGVGDGPVASSLSTRPADLSKLAVKNGGVLPVNSMYAMIVGEKLIPAHGQRSMPVWGNVYSREAERHLYETPQDNEAYVRGRILFLIEYINRLQTK
jgi:mono/diheme cytochrome c family protein